MTDYAYRRQAYKAARKKVREAMADRRLSEPEIVAIAKGVVDSDFHGSDVDMRDLVGACLHYQKAMQGTP